MALSCRIAPAMTLSCLPCGSWLKAGLARDGGQPPAHQFGEPRHQEAFDGESKPDRDDEVAKLSPPWPTGPDRPLFPAEASASRNSGRNPTWD